MVNTMTKAYNDLSLDEKNRIYIMAVGKLEWMYANDSFCLGSFGMCSDVENDPWWKQWNAAQRDVYIFHRNNDGEWIYFCHFSMNDHPFQFDDALKEALAITPIRVTNEGEQQDLLLSEMNAYINATNMTNITSMMLDEEDELVEGEDILVNGDIVVASSFEEDPFGGRRRQEEKQVEGRNVAYPEYSGTMRICHVTWRSISTLLVVLGTVVGVYR